MNQNATLPIQKTDWKQHWIDGRIGFHLSEFNPSLVRHIDHLSNCKNVLIPLCGKTLDLHFLHQRGHHCFGIELVKEAICDFFTEWGVEPTEDNHLTRYENISIYNQNIFSIERQDLPKINAIYDRAALVALPPDLREQYVEHLLSLLDCKGKILLFGYDMPRSQSKGPPFAVRKTDIQRLFRNTSSIQLIEEIFRTPIEEPKLEKRGLEWSKEYIWIIEK